MGVGLFSEDFVMRRASVKIVGGCVLAAYLVLNASAWAGIYSQVVGADDPVAYWRLGRIEQFTNGRQ